MQMDGHSLIKNIVNNELNLNSVDICFGNTMPMSCKSLQRIGKLATSKSPEFGLQNFECSTSKCNFKMVYLTRPSSDFNNLKI